MGEVQQIPAINWIYVFGAIILLIFAICFIFDTIVKFYGYIKKPVDWKNRNDNDHTIIEKLSETVTELKKQQDTDRDNLIELSDMVFEKNIEDMRWRILDFSSAISNGRHFNRESYDFILKTYEDYEELLKKKGRKNGLVDATIQYITNDYQDKLQKGLLK